MNKILGMAAVASLLAACATKVDEVIVPTDETVDIDVGVPGGPDDPVTVVISGGVVTVGDIGAGTAYDGSELVVQIAGLDGPNGTQLFTPSAVVRTDGFDEFEIQISALNRDYTALAKNSADGSLSAVVVMDGGQFNRVFGGATVQQSSLTAPESGTVSFLGDYAGLINGGGPAGLVPPGGADPILFAGAVGQVTGTVFLNANFTDNQVEGALYNRAATLFGGDYDLADLVFIVGDINDDGTFVSTVELDRASVGSYSGAFGGDDAASVAGAVALTGTFLLDKGGDALDFGIETDVEDAIEYGIFVFGACGPVGTDCPFPPPPL